MAQIIEFQGVEHEFPDDFTQADIAKALKSFGSPSLDPSIFKALPVTPPQGYGGGSLNAQPGNDVGGQQGKQALASLLPAAGAMVAAPLTAGASLPMALAGTGLGAAGGKALENFINSMQGQPSPQGLSAYTDPAMTGVYAAAGDMAVPAAGNALQLAKQVAPAAVIKMILGLGRVSPTSIPKLLQMFGAGGQEASLPTASQMMTGSPLPVRPSDLVKALQDRIEGQMASAKGGSVSLRGLLPEGPGPLPSPQTAGQGTHSQSMLPTPQGLMQMIKRMKAQAAVPGPRSVPPIWQGMGETGSPLTAPPPSDVTNQIQLPSGRVPGGSHNVIESNWVQPATPPLTAKQLEVIRAFKQATPQANQVNIPTQPTTPATPANITLPSGRTPGPVSTPITETPNMVMKPNTEAPVASNVKPGTSITVSQLQKQSAAKNVVLELLKTGSTNAATLQKAAQMLSDAGFTPAQVTAMVAQASQQ